MVVIIDYGMGNLLSVLKAFRRLNIPAKVTSAVGDIEQAEKLILPGVGNFKRGMQNLAELNLISVLNRRVLEERAPILGICLGMQLFTKHSEEGDAAGLGWFNAKTVRFHFPKDYRNLRVPHMGWNSVSRKSGDAVLFKGVESNASFYFVHSYHVKCDDATDVISTTEYGTPFVSSIGRDNIMGVQFHPEKSHDNGLMILKNFFELATARSLGKISI